MSMLYFRKSGASVVRMLDKGVAQISLPGYSQNLVVDFNDAQHVGPSTLTKLSAVPGAKGDIFLTPAYMFRYGIVPDADFVKWPESKGGSFAELWRSWALFARLDASGPVAEGLRALRGEVRGGALAACAARFAGGDLDGAAAELDDLAEDDSTAARSARHLLPPGDRSDRRKVSSVLRAAVAGILAGAV